MKSGSKSEVLLNYNSLTEEMIIENNGKKSAIKKEFIETIDTIFIEERKFTVVDNKLLELIYSSNYELFVEHKCELNLPFKPSAYGGDSQSSASTSYTSLISKDRVLELKLPDEYKVKPYTIYWLKKDGELHKFLNLRQLMKLFYSEKNNFKTYVKENNVKYDNQKSVIQLFKHLETY
jgi:hypothetical protein